MTSTSAGAEALVNEQVAEIARRAARGALTDSFSITHLGPKFANSLLKIALASEKGERAFRRFLRACINFERRRNPVSNLKLAVRALQLEEVISSSGLPAKETQDLTSQLQHYLRTVRATDEASVDAATKIVKELQQVGSRRVPTLLPDIPREIAAAKIRLAFLDFLATLSHANAALTGVDAAFIVAYRKIAKVIGNDIGGGWRPLINKLLEMPEQVKAYRAEIQRLEAAIAKETDPAKLSQLRDKALPSWRRSGVHSQAKGLLGELFVARWEGWRMLKSGYEELAYRLARKLGPDWEVLPVSGRMYLGGATKETWDEAVLLVRRGSTPPEAKLFMAGQIKTALEPRSLDQSVTDMAREAASKDLRVVLADGREELFMLTPLPANEPTHRVVLNAEGGTYPESDVAALLNIGVKIEQLTFPVSVGEVNSVIDRFIQVAVDLL